MYSYGSQHNRSFVDNLENAVQKPRLETGRLCDGSSARIRGEQEETFDREI